MEQPYSQATAAGPGAQQDAPAFALAAARIAADNKIDNVRVLDLRGLSTLADFFVLGTATSNRQMYAVFDHLEEHARSVQRRPFSKGDTTSGSWLLIDYVDVVIHLFDEEHREYYDLDALWGDAPEVDWRATATEA
jgi:ribosome-associated protein